jgi:hypothetical protein
MDRTGSPLVRLPRSVQAFASFPRVSVLALEAKASARPVECIGSRRRREPMPNVIEALSDRCCEISICRRFCLA